MLTLTAGSSEPVDGSCWGSAVGPSKRVPCQYTPHLRACASQKASMNVSRRSLVACKALL
jgi:hypothetical protein